MSSRSGRKLGRTLFALVVASLSGTLGWGSEARPKQTILDAYRAVPPRDLVVYVDSGGGPDGGDNYASNRRFADAMAAHGYRFNENLFHWHEPGAPHRESAWAARVSQPLALFEAMQ